MGYPCAFDCCLSNLEGADLDFAQDEADEGCIGLPLGDLGAGLQALSETGPAAEGAVACKQLVA